MKATFGAGCFWGVQEVFDKVNGVTGSLVGFMGGVTKNPSYNEVCSGSTGHTEVVFLDFNSRIVSYDDLLKVFFDIHDFSQLTKSQYKSVIFYHDESQRIKAVSYRSELINRGLRVVTEVLPASVFYRAEDYHQKYYKKNGGSCL